MDVLWRQKRPCPLAGPDMLICNCPIKEWSNKKMFVAHWQIYYIDQHLSRIVCEQHKYRVKCHYMTDQEGDMK